MTNCNPKPLSFSPLNRKKIQASFSGGSMTSDAGLLLLREIDKKLSFTKKVSKVINDTRHQGYVQHNVTELLRQRIYAIAAGYEDVNDHDHLCKDKSFQTSVGREVKLASASTLSRFENSIDRQSMIEISKLFVEQFIDSHDKTPTELILDFDPTDCVIYGKQEKRHYHGYYRDYCFLPMYVFCNGRLLVSLLRPSNIDGSKHAGAILKLLVKRLRETWPDVNIIFRGDGAFARKHILSWCERHHVDYVVGIATNNRLKAMAEPLTLQASLQYQNTLDKQRLFSRFEYAAKSWSRKRHIVAKAERHSKGDNLRFIVTSLHKEAKTIYDDWYCPRGDMENSIKQQLDLFADRMSCHDFNANQFRMLLSSMAYILLFELQQRSLKGTRLSNSYMRTLRLKLIKIAGVILKNTRRIQFLLPTHCPFQHEFETAVKNLLPP